MQAMTRPLVLSIALVFAVEPVCAGDDLPAEFVAGAVPQVLTPARLRQAQVDAGASVTVIDREMIAAMGARDVPELLRLVPGMMVTHHATAWHTYAVNYHGTNLTDIRRMQVLVDGMSFYQPALARVLWSELPLAIEDIERIEVTRGPDAAAYGANSFSGVVNIITLHPQDAAENLVRITGGNRDVLDGSARFVQHGADSDTRITVSGKSDSGFDEGRGGVPVLDDRRVGAFNLRNEFRVSSEDRLELMLGASVSEREEEADNHGILDSYEVNPLSKISSLNVLGRWSHQFSPDHELQVQAYSQRTDVRNPFRACLNPILLSDELAAMSAAYRDITLELLDEAAGGDGDPDAGGPLASDGVRGNVMAFYAALAAPVQALALPVLMRFQAFAGAGFVQTCGNVNLDLREARVDIEVQDTVRVGERLRLVSGFSYRHDTGSSASYTGSHVDSETTRVFAHGEYRVADPLLLNLGAMLERDGISGTGLSPRAALNFRVGEQQSVRLVSSRATRTQDLYEEYASTRIGFSNLSPPYSTDGGVTTDTDRDLFLIQTAPGNLRPEEINSLELGYFGYFAVPRVELDVRLFREHLNKLISDAMNPFSFESDNDSFTTLNGIEWQLKRRFAPGTWAWASYAYIDNDSTHRIESRFTALHSGSLALARRFNERWSGSAAWYFSREQNRTPINDDDFDRLDLRIVREIPLGASSLQLSCNLQGRFTDVPHIHADNRYSERIDGYVAAAVTF